MNREKLRNTVITLTADFGDRFAQAQMELVVQSINPKARFVVLSHEVKPFSILEGAFLLAKSYGFSPRQSIHIGVVDPGVGSERKGLLIKTQDHWFIGPDNGLLYPAATDDGVEEVFVLDEGKLNPGGLSTFHGRDVFAPAAARLSRGESPLSFAQQIDKNALRPYHLEPDQVAHIDPYGNAKLTTTPEQFRPGDRISFAFTTGSRVTIPYCRTFGDVPTGEFLAYQGSHGTLELARNLGSAAEALQLAVGQRLEINVLREAV